MASSAGVWGIDVGQCSLKALRCRLDDDGKKVVAEAFDYIEYPKILSQPEADPQELIREALQQFLSRNDVRHDKVAISVSGQSGLARFIKLPPVEAKKIPDIVKYEARQQIPFALDEVIWDYQRLAGGSEEEGFALETEVGLFAMKREQAFKTIKPYDRAGVELDIVQLSPLCLYNYVCHDLLSELPPPDEYDPENPPESVVVISVGTDTTDLVVTNGYRVWQRSIPLGGNHFTRALTKDLKLTFAKAEHLKRNAGDADDPKKIFQAMRPVFNDLVTEVQRSINYFQSIDRQAKIGKVVALGNAMKLPGLQQYLAKHLGFDVLNVSRYHNLGGKGVVSAPSFQENLLSFPVCYGLCLQGLNKAALSTNLIPRELIVQRMIREKKPWALATVAVLLLGLSFNFFFLNNAWRSVNVKRAEFQSAFQEVDRLVGKDTAAMEKDQDLNSTSEYLDSLGDEVVDNAERRLVWPELLTALTSALPHNEKLPHPQEIATVREIPLDQRRDLHITKVESEFFPQLSSWFNKSVAEKIVEDRRAIGSDGAAAAAPKTPAAAPADATPADATPAPADQAGAAAAPAAAKAASSVTPPDGAGWVIELQGYHDFSENGRNRGAQYIRETILKNLENMEVALPIGPGKIETARFSMKDLGISHPVLVWDSGPPTLVNIPNPEHVADENEQSERGAPVVGQNPDATNPREFPLERFHFIVQFVWRDDKTVTGRLEEKEQERIEADAEGSDQGTEGQVAAGDL